MKVVGNSFPHGPFNFGLRPSALYISSIEAPFPLGVCIFTRDARDLKMIKEYWLSICLLTVGTDITRYDRWKYLI